MRKTSVRRLANYWDHWPRSDIYTKYLYIHWKINKIILLYLSFRFHLTKTNTRNVCKYEKKRLTTNLKKHISVVGWSYSSVAECMNNMCKILGSYPSTHTQWRKEPYFRRGIDEDTITNLVKISCCGKT